MSPEHVIFISDMDDTLLNNEKQISAKNLEAISAFRQMGGMFTVATGRSVRSVEPYREIMNLDIPVILCNGGCIYDYERQKTAWKMVYPKEIEVMLRELSEEFPRLGIHYMTEEVSFCYHPTPAYTASMEKENLPYHVVQNLRDMPDEYLKVELISDMVNQRELDIYLNEYMLKECQWIYTGNACYDIVVKGVSKGNAIKRYIEKFGLVHKTICCIGDHNNDYEMIHNADYGFAVGNALEYIKNEADYVVEDNNHDAVRRAIAIIKML